MILKYTQALYKVLATIQVKSETTSTALFQLVDYSGRIILQKNVPVQAGTNNVVVNDFGNLQSWKLCGIGKN